MISLTLGTIVNPISVRNPGDFVITTWTRANWSYHVVDQATVDASIYLTTSGLIYKEGEVQSDSLVTYDSETVYTFKMSFEHHIPLDGKIRFNLPEEMAVYNIYELMRTCYRVD